MRDALGEVQSVLVLGGGSDIGRAVCLRARPGAGAGTVILAGRPEDDMEKVADDVRAAGATVELRHWDATDVASHTKVIGDIFDEFGDIDLVYAPAGILGSQEAFDARPGRSPRRRSRSTSAAWSRPASSSPTGSSARATACWC